MRVEIAPEQTLDFLFGYGEMVVGPFLPDQVTLPYCGCVIRTARNGDGMSRPVIARGMVGAIKGQAINRPQLRRQALKLALDNAGLEREQRRKVWEVYRKTHRFDQDRSRSWRP